MQNKILFVDDEIEILNSINRSLSRLRVEWQLDFAESGNEALEKCRINSYDLIVTDARMPIMNGSELLKNLRKQEITRNIPTIMLTGYADREIKREALKQGIIEYLNKPFESEDLMLRLKNVLRLKNISNELHEKNIELEKTRMQIIRRLGKAAEYKDDDTGKHVIRVAHYSRIIAEEMHLDKSFVDLVFYTAPMHDIGKIGVPDEILKKPDKLIPEEYYIMQKHSSMGEKVFEPLSDEEMYIYLQHPTFGKSILSEQDTPLLNIAAEIAGSHHEKWDGTGYPQGLKGEEIPLSGRIVAIADIFDALSSKRVYKPAFSIEKCMQIICDLSGTHLDPKIVDVFNSNIDKILKIKKQIQG